MSSAVKTPVAPDFEALFRRAIELRDQGHQSEAVELLRQVRDMRPNSAAVYAVLGEICWEQHNFDEAIPLFRRAVELSPSSELASLGLFHTLWDAGQTQAATQEMLRFVSLSTSEDYANLARGLVREELGKDSEYLEQVARIKEFFKDLLQTRPQLASTSSNEALIYLWMMQHPDERRLVAEARVILSGMKRSLRKKRAIASE
jgi:predicted Zn-dependent protease